MGTERKYFDNGMGCLFLHCGMWCGCGSYNYWHGNYLHCIVADHCHVGGKIFEWPQKYFVD